MNARRTDASLTALLLNVVGLLGAAAGFAWGTPLGLVVGFVATAACILAAWWQYHLTTPYRARLTKDMFRKNAAGEWGVLILGSEHKRGLHPKVTVMGTTSEGSYCELVTSTRYLGNGDLEIDSYPQELDVLIRA